ncbi:MAG: sulfurtransferase [Alphaproteobacteria bacterium]|nr:sulfurtransferase [Alphaproteobacteria bacterium]
MADATGEYRDPQALVQTDWLEASLADPALRIYDCTTYLLPADAETEAPYIVQSGRADYDNAHIPGADFLDLQGELSDNGTRLRFMAPSEAQFSAAMSRHGIGAGTRVILYSAGNIMWATRLWWMLRAFGFDRAAVLDGGWDKWIAEGRAISTEPSSYPPAQFTARPRPGLIVDKGSVLDAIDDDGACVINALNEQYFLGEEPSRYGRPGRIPGSVGVSAATLIDPDTNAFVSLPQAQARFDSAGVGRDDRIIAYCGGGISATIDLFLLHQLGYDDLTLYDASMGEWARDESLPIERG